MIVRVLCFPLIAAAVRPFDLPCGFSALAQAARSGLKSFTLPDHRTRSSCPGRFCYLHRPLSTASDDLPAIGIQHSLCLVEESCNVANLSTFFDSMCSVVRCSDLPNEEEQGICVLVQALHCNPRERFAPGVHPDQLSLRCDSDSDMERLQITSLLECGSAALGDVKYAMMSGGLQDLGDFDGCSADTKENRYCTIKYYEAMTMGRCLPATCTQDHLNSLLAGICSDRFNCLEYLNVVPIDLCVASKFLGCGTAASFSLLERASMADIFAHRAGTDRGQSLLSATREGQMPDTADVSEILRNITQKATHAIRSVDPGSLYPDLHADYEGHLGKIMRPYFIPSNLGKQVMGIEMKSSFTTMCDFESVSKSRPDWWIWLGCTVGFLFILPLMAHFGLKYGARCGGRMRSVALRLKPFHVPKNKEFVLTQRDRYANGTWSHVCGIRVASMVWVVSGHAFAFAGLSVVHNSGAFVDMLTSWTFQGILSGQLAVDTFFFMSGFMLYTTGIKRLEKLECHTVTAYFKLMFQRWWRLTGLLAFVMIISYYGIQYFNNGPQWPGVLTMLRTGHHGGCQRWWWLNLLYLNNLELGFGDFSECFPHGWYLACDFQFAAVGTALLLLAVKQSRRTFMLITTIALGVALGICIYVVTANDLRFPFGAVSAAVNSDTRSLQEGAVRSWHLFYVKPWTRIPPYLVGLLAAALHESDYIKKWVSKDEDNGGNVGSTVENSEIELATDSVLIYMGHCFFAFTMLLLVYILPYESNKHNAPEWNRVFEVLYMACQRTVWAICVGWFTVILALTQGGKGPQDWLTGALKALLSGRLVALLSLTCYGTYLVHPLVQTAYYGSAHQAAGLTEGSGYVAAIAQTVIGFSIGGLLYLFVEVPLAQIH